MKPLTVPLDDEQHVDWLHGKKPKKKEVKESMSPFKQTDGDKLQHPRVQADEGRGVHNRVTGKRKGVSGYGANKKEV